MKLTITKLPVSDAERMRTLVVEHAEGIETGLTVLDSRLLLGQATIDVVGSDARSSLVLMTIGLTADEQMVLRAVEAYSWCLEYPESVRRLYPSIELSVERPPRMMFVIERAPDSFTRKIKQLGFAEADCVEMKHLDVDGTSAVFFEVVARLRRGGLPAPAVAPAAAPTTLLDPRVASERTRRERRDVPAKPETSAPAESLPRVEGIPVHLPDHNGLNGHGGPGETVAAEPSPVAAALVAAEAVPAVARTPVAEPVPAPAPVATGAPATAASPEPAERVSLRQVAALLNKVAKEPVAPPATSGATPEPGTPPAVSFADAVSEMLRGMPYPIDEASRAEVEKMLASQPASTGSGPAKGSVEPAISIKPAAVPLSPIAAARPSPLGLRPPVAAPAMKPVAAVPAPAPAPEAAAPQAEPEKATKLPAELAGIQIPEGALTRQWMEFLTQMAAAK